MNTRKIAGTGILLALTMVFTSISNYVQIGTISINLSLIPISLAGILFGPLSGLITGLVNGAFILLAPSTSAFFAISVGGTVFTCLFKGAMTGILCWLIYYLIQKKNKMIGICTSALAAPIINTTIFIICSLIFFKGSFGNLISIFISINFAIEFVANIVVVPPLAKVVIKKIPEKKENNTL